MTLENKLNMKKWLEEFVCTRGANITNAEYGLCGNVPDSVKVSVIDFMIEHAPNWKHFSGCYAYPVSGSKKFRQHRKSNTLYRNKQMYYRMSLAKHLIKKLDQDIQQIKLRIEALTACQKFLTTFIENRKMYSKYKTFGICCNLDSMLMDSGLLIIGSSFIEEYSQTWEHYSGSKIFPVSGRNIYDANLRAQTLYTGKQLYFRLSLAKHLVRCIHRELKEL